MSGFNYALDHIPTHYGTLSHDLHSCTYIWLMFLYQNYLDNFFPNIFLTKLNFYFNFKFFFHCKLNFEFLGIVFKEILGYKLFFLDLTY